MEKEEEGDLGETVNSMLSVYKLGVEEDVAPPKKDELGRKKRLTLFSSNNR